LHLADFGQGTGLQRAKAGTDAVPAAAADADRRIDAIAERYYAAPRRGPRIRGL